MTRQPQRLPELLSALDSQGVAYDDELRTFIDATAQLNAITMIQAGAPSPMSSPPKLLGATVTQLLERAGEHQLRTVLRTEFAHAIRLVLNELAEQALDLLTRDADAILNQLRPRFTSAAVAVRKAAEVGVRPGMRAANVIEDDNQRRHFLAARDQAAALEEIAALRILLSEVLDLPPFREQARGFPRARRGARPSPGRPSRGRSRTKRRTTAG